LITLKKQLQESELCYDTKSHKDKSEYVIDIIKEWLVQEKQKFENKNIDYYDKLKFPYCFTFSFMFDRIIEDLKK
jgi:hypothetical protein